MYRLKRSDLTKLTVQAPARATKATFQAADSMTFFVEKQEAMEKSDIQGGAPDENLRKSVFTDQFKEDLKYWQKASPKTVERIRELMQDILAHPSWGIGKPEHTKYQGSNVWSRRITKEHRIVYLVTKDQIDFLQARYHYEK